MNNDYIFEFLLLLNMKKNNIKEQSYKLSVIGVTLFIQMMNQKEYVLSKQFVKAITSIGANVEEAYDAESKKDFIHKLSISLKEARESMYWVRLIDDTALVNIDTREIKLQLNSVTAILVSIIKSSKINLGTGEKN